MTVKLYFLSRLGSQYLFICVCVILKLGGKVSAYVSAFAHDLLFLSLSLYRTFFTTSPCASSLYLTKKKSIPVPIFDFFYSSTLFFLVFPGLRLERNFNSGVEHSHQYRVHSLTHFVFVFCFLFSSLGPRRAACDARRRRADLFIFLFFCLYYV